MGNFIKVKKDRFDRNKRRVKKAMTGPRSEARFEPEVHPRSK